MTLRVLSTPFLFLVALGWLTGCERPAAIKKDKDADKSINVEVKQSKESSPFQSVNEEFKYPNNPRSNDDWTRYRDGLQKLADHFNKSEVIGRLRLTEKEREFLEKEVHLNKAELAEVESTVFRSADAFHMDECYLLRDVAHHLEVPGISPLEQATLDFRWVMRNVMLHQSLDTWLPPSFVVRRGFGSALDRALVYLALLRQSQIEGCLIVVPDSDPPHFLIGVLDAPSKSLRLFDPRLERPVPSKDGKGIATLQEALETPALLQASMITPEQTKKLEAWMVCPLYALSPRMLELQKGLRSQDFVTLYMSPEFVRGELAKATTLPIKVWNAEDNTQPTAKNPVRPPNSPTRALRLFLPKSEGGLDDADRLIFFDYTRIPNQGITVNYSQIKLTRDLLPLPAYQFLIGISKDLLGKYELQTRELYLRGKYEPMNRRQDRIQDFATNNALANLTQDETFQKERAEWQKNILDAFASLPAENVNPGARNKMLMAMQGQWAQDQYVGFLLEVDKEDKFDRNLKKTVLTKILAVGLRDYLETELIRAKASAFHEMASDRQASLVAAKNPSKGLQTRANDGWFNAKSAWGNSYVDRIAIEQLIQDRLQHLRTWVHPEDFNTRVRLLEVMHHDVQKYFQGRLRLAECLAYTDGVKAANASLTKTKQEIESMEKADLLNKEIKAFRSEVPAQVREFMQKRLDLLEQDWTPTGNYFWLKRQIDVRLGVDVNAQKN